MESSLFAISAYDYELPKSLIAQYPSSCRGNDRLMVVDRDGRQPPIHTNFANLCRYLPANAILVANNSRVIKCRLPCRRPNGGKSEFLLLTPLPAIPSLTGGKARVHGLLRPASKSAIQSRLAFSSDMEFVVEEKGPFGQCTGTLTWNGNLEKLLSTLGKTPLPPYISRQTEEWDDERYQTVYAKNPGSAAAPTAGLHFNNYIREELTAYGFEWLELTLHVGYGTFSPVRENDIRRHAMHAEYVELTSDAAETLQKAKASGRPVIAIGTTSLRALEGIWAKCQALDAYQGFINIFLYPGKRFNVATGLLTNFHLPRSTLLMLVCAFGGYDNVLKCYRNAIENNYRFFSYGDAMLIR